MALGGSFKEDHPYATGLVILVVAGFGVAGSVTGQLAAMLAALWTPSALIENTSYGQNSGGSSFGGGFLKGLFPASELIDTSTSSSATTAPGGPPANQANVGSTSGITGVGA